ncbi:MAG: hypothetical protein PHU88_00305 [candidate division Zixibacteria bacterium]|nr:hypothetical protein [candidate division Zixibacteria bacterium]MDD5426662.1 hypothetical protein [candidate division Zixibacteria bacterium]
MSKKLFIILSVFFILTTSLYPFDGKRKGFVIGCGLGFAPLTKWSGDSPRANENKAGFAANIMIGYARNEHSMFVYESNVVIFNSDHFQDRYIAQGFNGFSWYYFLNPDGESFFFTFGFGLSVFQVESCNPNNPEYGFLFGGGYELSRHSQVGGYFCFGKTVSEHIDYNQLHFAILVTTVAF